MKILFVLENYLPAKNGGIENYTHWLATVLLSEGYLVEVAFLNLGENETYYYESVKVNKLVDHLRSFEKLLISGNFDICHFQEYSSYGGIEIDWFKKAKEYCKKVFFTFHLPYLTCYKGDFRYCGTSDCNDFSSIKRCVECILSDRLGSKYLGGVVSFANAGLKALKFDSLTNRLENRIALKNYTLNELVSICTNVFIYADWFKRVLTENGYLQETINMIPYKTKNFINSPIKPPGTKLIKNSIVFVGRIEPQKGLHLLCRALQDLRNLNITLDVYGNIVDEHYFKKCKALFSFNFKRTVTRFELLKIFGLYDFLILPSVFTEMYSMVVKDALYESLPVIVSSSKGNRAAVVDGKTGFIFKYGDAQDLGKVLINAYKLLDNGWQGDFSYVDNSEEDLKEILSYYIV